MTNNSSIKFTRGVPAVESFPTAQLAECATTVLAEHSDVVLQYGKARGFPLLCEQIAHMQGVDTDRVIVGQGSLQLLDLIARMLFQPGSLVYAEDPSYDRTITILRRAGGHVVGFPLSKDGLDVEAVAARLKAGEIPVCLYIIPDFQNPSGSVLSFEKRQRLVQLARDYEFWIIEDVPYRRLRYRGDDIPTCFSMAPERVIQMSSYSKQICPGIRVGYAITPDLLKAQLAKMAEDTYISPSYFDQAVVYEFIRRGWLEPQIERLKALYAPRLDMTLAVLAETMIDLGTWTHPDGGFFIGLTLDGPINTDALLARARDANLFLTDGRGFFTASGENFVRLPFCALTPDEIEEGIVRLAEVVRKVK
ncbi:MAG: PLP-dependent aminotransferase family protein [Anaerolineae bacterium]|nr:PLP-dependent aminotransferase family protein [Anaerolineae bacterium]